MKDTKEMETRIFDQAKLIDEACYQVVTLATDMIRNDDADEVKDLYTRFGYMCGCLSMLLENVDDFYDCGINIGRFIWSFCRGVQFMDEKSCGYGRDSYNMPYSKKKEEIIFED